MKKHKGGGILITGIALLAGISLTFLAPEKTVGGQQKSAYFAGGCFWCVEADFE